MPEYRAVPHLPPQADTPGFPAWLPAGGGGAFWISTFLQARDSSSLPTLKPREGVYEGDLTEVQAQPRISLFAFAPPG